MKTPALLLLTVALILATIAPPGLSLLHEAQANPILGGPTLAQAAAIPTSSLNALPVDIRVNAGGPDYLDSQGKLWLADKLYTPSTWGYTAGTAYTNTIAIADTVDDPLYQTQRSTPGQYLFDIGNGVFEVELRFAEIYPSGSAIGFRSFNVTLEGGQVLANLDLMKTVGFGRAFNTTFLVKVTDGQLVIGFSGLRSVINAIRVSGGPTGLGRNEIRLNAAGYDYTDTQGKFWVSDQPYTQGTLGYLGASSNAFSTVQPISGSNDQPLFKTNRYGMTGYTFDVENGQYRVDLLLAEIYGSINSVGARVFDVWAEGTKVISGTDVFKIAGGKYKAITQTFAVTVLDQQLNITFTQKTPAQAPIVNAIAILPLDSAAPGSWANFTPTGWQTTRTPSASIQVQDSLSGLNVSSGQYAFSTNGGATFSAWQPASVTGANGVTTTQLMVVGAVPFNQDSATQNKIKFHISDMSGNLGESLVYTVQVDSMPPASAITAPATGSLVSGPTLAIQGTATDAASGVQSVEVSVDSGGSWQAATGTTSWSYNWAVSGEGVYNIRSRARDNVGFVESPGPGVTVTVDSVAPVTFIRTPFSGQVITSATFLITGTAFDATSGVRRVEASLDGGASWITTTGTTAWSYNWTPSQQGSYMIRARAVDMAGNIDTPGTAVNVIVDRVAPTSTISDPVSGRVIRGTSYTISGSASDDASGSGLSLVEVSTDALTWDIASGLATWTYGWELPSDGSYTIRSRAYDLAGNVQTPPASVTVMVDNAPPVSVSSLNGTAGTDGWYVSPLTLSILASDATSGVRSIYYRVGAGDWVTYTAAVQIATQGSQTVAYYAVDQAGNTEAAHSVQVRIDTVAPLVTRSLAGTVGGGGWFRSAIGLSLLATDSTSGVRAAYYSLDGGAWTQYSGQVMVTAEGTHTVQYYAVDMAGNSATVDSVTFKIDTLAPVSTITFPSAGQVIGGANINIQGTANDAGGSGLANVEVSINGGVWAPASGSLSWSYSWTPPGPGQHNIRVRATDLAHNAEVPGSGIYVTADTTRPTSSIVSPFNGEIVQGPTVLITGTAADTYSSVALVEISANGGASWQPATLGSGGTWSFNWAVANDGIYNLRSRATDQAGNVESVASGISVQVDSIAPQSLIAVPTNGQYIRSTSYQITGTATDIGAGVKRVEVSIDAAAWVLASGTAQWSYSWSPVSDDGSHTIRSRATDNAGNVESPGQSVTVFVDNGRPASSIVLPTNGQVITTPILFISGVASDAVTGVHHVEITVRRGLNSFYWDGAGWVADETWLPTMGTTAEWNYLMTDLPKVGMLTIVSRATDNMGNVEIPGAGVTISIQRGFTVVLPIIINDFNQ